jgi:hypothetical protein
MGKARFSTLVLKLPLLAALLAPLALSAADYSITSFTIDGGGGASTGGQFSLTGTIGQPEAGVLSGGQFTLQSGFWGAGAAIPTQTAPVLAAVPDQTVDELTLLRLTLSATDSDLPANTLTFSLVSGPSGLAATPTGELSWTPTEAQGPGTYDVTVRVTDNGSPAMSADRTFKVTVREVNTAPVLATVPDQSVDELTLLRLTLSATDNDLPANTFTFSLVSGPSGLAVTPTGELTWTPTEAQGPGTYDVTVRVTDNGSPAMSADKTFKVTVREVNTAPVLAAVPDRTVDLGNTLRFTASATDADVPANALTFSLDAAPSGMSVDPTTGEVTWTPTILQSPSTNVVTLKVTDSGSPPLSASRTFNVVVRAKAEIRLTVATCGVGCAKVTVSAVPGYTIAIHASADLSASNWPEVFRVKATGNSVEFTDQAAGKRKFYRAVAYP